ncbi:unnamed protein product [Vitrella brassicaformis CCMP3155]|uniref:PCI domain-containing protein n=2 Tax=Vitrella brassicaformis TaxID=1169539 RepID=A0A0G4G8I0_VITBC|nr:unnamed protein product [Vitrella brassicaformis CCMP3155]|eukprot:CEM25104.1 unnamed protein product [Vitrella brassicaformis CCMP3155]
MSSRPADEREDEDMGIDATGGETTSRPVPPTEKYLPENEIADWRFELTLPDALAPNKEEAKAKIMMKIRADGMLPYYTHLCESLGWPVDQSLVESLRKANEDELKGLEDKIKDAEENLGDTEVRDGLLEKAHFYCRIGDKEAAIEAYQVAYDKTVGAGSRLDIILTLVRLGIFTHDLSLTKKNVQRAKDELEKGGDWERRNKLKVYEGVMLMMIRSFKEAAELFLSAVATFTATELLSFERFIQYTVVLSMVALGRPVLREKVVHAPEVLQVTQGDHDLRDFLNSFYQGDYKKFMEKLIPITDRIRSDRYLHLHYRYLVRNLRLRAYAQFLEPYKSVTLGAMASAFGVSPDFMENEVAGFIATGKLSCKIDKVGRIIESNRPDARNALYLQTIKQGDALLNRIQKLSRVIDM